MTIQLNDIVGFISFTSTLQGSYTTQIKPFICYIQSTGQDITWKAIQDYIISVNSDPSISASTKEVRRYAVKYALRRFFKNSDIKTQIMLDRALTLLDREAETKAPEAHRSAVARDKTITEGEYRILLQKAHSERQRRFIEFLFITGCRVSEMLNIHVQADVTKKDDVVECRVKGKGSRTCKYKERIVLIPLQLYEDILLTFGSREYLFETKGNKKYLRGYVSAQIRKLGKDVLGKTISAHTLRHSFVTLMIARTGDIKGVSRYVGHSSVSMTLDMYCHSELEKDELFRPYFMYYKESA